MTKHYSHQNTGTCSKRVEFDLTDGKIFNVRFIGGCPGNTLGLAALLEGMDAKEAAERMKGILCGYKETSCPDQLSDAILEALAEN